MKAKSQSISPALILLHLCFSAGQGVPILSVEPENPVVKFGDPLILKCRTTCLDIKILSWETSLPRTTITRENGVVTLQINSITEYIATPSCFANCGVGNGSVSQLTKKVAIHVYKLPPPVLTVKPTALAGEDISVTCSVSDTNPPVTLRLKNSTTVLSQKKGVTNDTIRYPFKAGIEDNGMEFVCEAEVNVSGEIKSERVNCSFNVLYPPAKANITVQPQNITQGDNITIVCKADSNPPPVYNWTYPSSGNVQIFKNNTTIQITKSTSSNNGNYTCEVINEHGNSVAGVSIQVQVSGQDVPMLSVEPENPIVKYGDPLTLVCRTTCSDIKRLSWETTLTGINRTPGNGSITLDINNVTEFTATPSCFANCDVGNGSVIQLTKKVAIHVYKTETEAEARTGWTAWQITCITLVVIFAALAGVLGSYVAYTRHSNWRSFTS